jgi:uncharacterized SAM-binding protein YcdF (DUF218 family)
VAGRAGGLALAAVEPGPAPILGAEGIVTWLLAVGVAGLTLGGSLAVAFWHVLRAALAASPEPPGPAGRVVVLGARLVGGRPGPAFRARLDRALALAAARPGLRLVVLGGITAPGAPAEAVVGRRHLIAAGLAPGRVAVEARSRHTLENLREFRAGFGAGLEAPVLLVTSRSHLARAVLMARGLGLPVLPCAAEAGRMPAREWRRLAVEAFLLHWYVVGRGFARLTGNARMLARIT